MPDPRVVSVAHVLVDYSIDVQPGELVVLSGDAVATPLILSAYQRVLERGGHPYLRVSLGDTADLFYTYASDEQLDYAPQFEMAMVEEFDAYITIWAEVNTRMLSNVDPAKQARRRTARRPWVERFYDRVADKALKWVGTLYPTQASAMEAEMSLREYEDFVYRACLVHEPDPIAAWKRMSQEQQHLTDWLADKAEIHLVARDTDLWLNVNGRRWENCDGRQNFPDGEVFTGPVEDGVNGHVRFSYPAIYDGREVDDVCLWFEHGRVVKATAAKNEAFLRKMLDTDAGARVLGEFAFGTNQGIQRFTKNMLFDEKIGGTVHMAVGLGAPETGSRNKSAIHWDMLCDLRQGGEVWVDGQLFVKDGAFVI
jgi:aminopeptidase